MPAPRAMPPKVSTLLRPEASYSTEGRGIKPMIGKMQNVVAGWFEALSTFYRATLAVSSFGTPSSRVTVTVI